MSHSPISDFGEQVVAKYKHRWAALVRLIHADHSFSGSERHCAFLNLDGERFADISAVTGFDFAEDGRALVTDDWDFDGDLDVWVTARTAPRLRLLENESQDAGESFFIRLQGNGKTTNSEAIGARCEVWLAGDERPLTRSVRAGDSFLSQASSWLHFGLGHKPEIARVVVHWPAGEREEFSGLESGGRYLLTQGQPQAKRWHPPAKIAKTQAQPLLLPHEPGEARIVLPKAQLLPQLQTIEGEAIADSILKGPVLINLWSQTCSSCLKELKEWAKYSPQFKEAGLRVLGLNVDEVSGLDLGSGAQQFLDELNFPYSSLAINEDTIQRLDLFQRSFLDRWLPLPVPCSFLLDSNGRVAAIYKGATTAETVLADMALLDASPEILRDQATPFSGRWAGAPPLIGPKKYIGQLLDHTRVSDTERYYERYLTLERQLPEQTIGLMVDALKNLAVITSQRGDARAAVSYLQEAVALVPESADLQLRLENMKKKAEQISAEDPLPSLLAQVEKDPKNGKAHLALGDAYREKGKTVAAVESYKNALRNDPKLFVAAGKLAWIFGTDRDSGVRDPKTALLLANRLMSLGGGRPDANILDLHGIALAANENYSAAAKRAQEALDSLKEESPYKQAIRLRLSLYQEGKAYYE